MRLLDKIIFLLLFVGLLFISLNRHSHHPIFNYHSQIFADKAGYHVYLPGYFYYDMEADSMEKSLVEKTGNGFRFEENKIITKYPIGVAICQLPFFALASGVDAVKEINSNQGFTDTHHLALNWATAVWGVLGLVLIFLTAIRYWSLSRNRAYLLVFTLLFTTNLLYYMTRDCGMSHTYSFTVFAAIQYLVFSCLDRQKIATRDVLLLLPLFSLLIVLRPLNLLFVLLPLTYILLIHRNKIKRLKFSIRLWGWIVGVILGAIPLLLQISYNYYAYGKPIADGYENESFSNLSSMDLLMLWFSPNNGALLYSPLLVLVFVAVIQQFRVKNYLSLIYPIFFLVISFTYAAWWSPELGCGFGHRGFTEHLAFFALPIAGFFSSLSKPIVRITWIGVIVVAALLFVAQFNFDGCWQSENNWNWGLFFSFFRI